MTAQENNSAVAAVSGFFKAIGGFFADFGTAVVKGDAFVKLSLIWMGAGYAKRKPVCESSTDDIAGDCSDLFFSEICNAVCTKIQYPWYCKDGKSL